MIDETARVTFPPGWATGEVVGMQGYVIDRPGGRIRVYLASLDDGVGLLAITYPGGRRMARMDVTPDTSDEPTWDEVVTGEPDEDIAELAAELWDVWIECCVQNGEKGEGEQ